MKLELTVATSDDWDALYINGIMAYEHHSIPENELLNAITKFINDNQPITACETERIDLDRFGDAFWGHVGSQLPPTLVGLRTAMKLFTN